MYSFSLVTACYNSAKFIEKNINAVINSGYDLNLIEHLIIDDGSTDNIQEVLKPYLKKYSHIKYIKKENGNWGSVINYVVNNKLIKNDYVLIYDSDDLITKNAFKIVSKKAKDCDMFFGSMYLWNGKKRSIKTRPCYWLFSRNVVKRNNKKVFFPITVPIAIYIKKEIFLSIPKLQEKVSHQDTPLFMHVFNQSKTIRFTSKIIGKYFKYRPGNTMTNFADEKNIQNIINNCKVYGQYDYPEAIVYYLTYSLAKKAKNKMIKEGTKFSFSRKPSFGWVPWFARWIMTIIYHCKKINKIIVIDKNIKKRN